MNSAFLSKKGTAAAQKPARVDMDLYFEAMKNRFHSQENPEGAFPMNVAENHLCWEMLKNRIQKVTREKNIPNWVASYGDPSGIPKFKEATANFLSKFLIKEEVNPESLAFSVGATSVIEMTAFLLGDPGDTAVIPAPSYPVYTGDIGVFPSIQRYDLQTHQKMEELNNGIPIHTDQLEQAKREIEAAGSRFRMLILTSPDNPTGAIYTEEQLRQLADWCISHQIHLVVNEIYGLTPINHRHPEIKDDYPNPIQFVSFGKIMAEYHSPFLHFWYSFSKDFGISGFRVGLLHSLNEDLIKAYRNIGLSHSISNYTQWVLAEVLNDLEFLEQYFSSFQKALTESYLIVSRTLKELSIPFNPSYGSLFTWMDLSEFLNEKSDSGEEELWLDIYQQTKILLTPTHGFGHQQKGLFRMVITSFDHSDLEIAMGRIKEYVLKKRNG